jgi:ABC-type polysaccharide/polyol phosphate transport system ATPase subunit
MYAVRFDQASKSFPRHTGQMLLRDRLLQVFRSSRKDPFYALSGVSLQLDHGESLAVIGGNGAGKSTLLSLVARLSYPDQGTVDVRGRVAALLELGSGFHPDLNGAENIRINATLLGLSRRQTMERFDQIVEFSGIGEFMDEPIRTYSAGMTMRLAFSVAVFVDPDIILIDEVLGVGDQAFFVKCVERIFQLKHEGKTIICVSHSTEILKQLCDTGLWLDHGRVVRQGPVDDVITAYQAEIAKKSISPSVHELVMAQARASAAKDI